MKELETKKVPTMVTIGEASQMTNLTYYAIRKLIRENKICCITVGNKHLINFEKLVEYLESGDLSA